MRSRIILLLTWCCAWAWTVTLEAEVIPEVRVAADASQRYALFVPAPAAGDAELRRPLLLLFDPRGRALKALELFRPAAEKLGWLVASSYETRSDAGAGPAGERNRRAIPALLDDVQRRQRVDPRRLYLAGMSGTARVAWAYALGLGDHTAGVVAAAGGLPVAPRAFPFAYFGTAGTSDFNYGEMRTLDGALDGLATHRFAYFDGGHGWPPAEIAGRALHWLELRAMVDGRRPVDPLFVEAALAADAEAFAAQEKTSPREALDLAEQVLVDYRGFAGVDLGGWRSRAERLRRDKAIANSVRAEAKALALEVGYQQTLAQWRRGFEEAEQPPLHAQSLSFLRVAALHREAASKDPARVASARRRLATAAAVLTSELPDALRRRDDWRRLAATFELAVEVEPESAWSHAQLARARARLGQWRPAHAAFRRARELGFDPAAPPDDDPLWEKLKIGAVN